MIKAEVSGLRDLSNKLRGLAQRAQELNGQHNIPLPDLLTPKFLADCSRFGSADELFAASGFKVDSPEDFKAIPDEEWDAFIQNNTSYQNWQEMLSAAAMEWSKKRLQL